MVKTTTIVSTLVQTQSQNCQLDSLEICLPYCEDVVTINKGDKVGTMHIPCHQLAGPDIPLQVSFSILGNVLVL